MNRLDYKNAMRRIKYANKRQGLKWNKAEIRQAADIVMAMQPKKQENWRGGSKPEGIANLLNEFMGKKL